MSDRDGRARLLIASAAATQIAAAARLVSAAEMNLAALHGVSSASVLTKQAAELLRQVHASLTSAIEGMP